MRLGTLMQQASERGHVSAAHDLSDGGLAQVLVEACLRNNVGARVTLPMASRNARVRRSVELASMALTPSAATMKPVLLIIQVPSGWR